MQLAQSHPASLLDPSWASQPRVHHLQTSKREKLTSAPDCVAAVENIKMPSTWHEASRKMIKCIECIECIERHQPREVDISDCIEWRHCKRTFDIKTSMRGVEIGISRHRKRGVDISLAPTRGRINRHRREEIDIRASTRGIEASHLEPLLCTLLLQQCNASTGSNILLH